MIIRIQLVVFLFCCPVFAEQPSTIPLFRADVKNHAEKALEALAMTSGDARFTKNHGEPKWALSWVTNTLNDPFQLPEVADRIFKETAATRERLQSQLVLSRDLLELSLVELISVPDHIEKLYVPFEIPDILSLGSVPDRHEVEGCLGRGQFGPLMVFTNISFADREYLAASVLASAFNTERNEKNREVLIAAGISRDAQIRAELESDALDGTEVAEAWLDTLSTINMELLHAWYGAYSMAVYELRDKMKEVSGWPGQRIEVETYAGLFIIGTEGPDVYDRPAALIIDPGGDDIYRNGAGSANGLVDRWGAAVIDLGGNDRYLSDGLLAPGSALFGFSVLLDESGNDFYESDYVGTAAAICGASWVEDKSGNDIYRAHAICQGAGITGFGTLVDHEGNDHYQAGFYGQGFAGVKGWGMLADLKGNDVYIAGNVRADSDRHEDRYLSLSQGYSIGARPHAGGGVASLIDCEGNDTYSADVYGQGSGYYYSAGFLIDISGNDRYTLHQYGQGCGIHFGLGLLADCTGDDMYSGFVLTQGAAHDYAVGMLFDHIGNDTYTADHHAQGRALNNAFALLVDREGNDGYFGRQRDGTQGIGNEGGFRDYGSLALLLDLNGHDIYSGGFSNRMITLRPLYGAVYDFEEEENDSE